MLGKWCIIRWRSLSGGSVLSMILLDSSLITVVVRCLRKTNFTGLLLSLLGVASLSGARRGKRFSRWRRECTVVVYCLCMIRSTNRILAMLSRGRAFSLCRAVEVLCDRLFLCSSQRGLLFVRREETQKTRRIEHGVETRSAR